MNATRSTGQRRASVGNAKAPNYRQCGGNLAPGGNSSPPSPPHVAAGMPQRRRTDAPARAVVFVSGNFFVVHPGHVRLLRFAADCGDVVVGVYDTQPAPGYPNPQERAAALRELGLVQEVVVMEQGLENFLRELRPAIVVKGKEWEAVVNPEAEWLSDWQGQLIFSAGESTYSNSVPALRDKRIRSEHWIRPGEYIRRHGCGGDAMGRVIASFAQLKVVVVGDTIVDEYLQCEALGMSREDPTIVLAPQSTECFVGGAGIVAAHARALGAQVSFVSVIGQDQGGRFAAARLDAYGVHAELLVDSSRPTTLKQRFRASGQTMMRVSNLRQHEISLELQAQIQQSIAAKIDAADVVLFSDFNYGCLPQPLVAALIERARAGHALVAADSQSSSQLGDISRFRGAHLLTPTEHEARLALRDHASGLHQIGFHLRDLAQVQTVFLTLGEAGVMVVGSARSEPAIITDTLPALNPEPRDVSGAGDSMLTAASLAMASGASAFQAAYLGSLAAAIQTSRVGNVPIQVQELRDALT
jgi:rfaE bifunctional protein kinase chain/domain